MESKQNWTQGGDNAHQTFVLKVKITKEKKLTHCEITDCITEQTGLVITQVCKESKLWVYLDLWQPCFSFTYTFKLTYKCFVGPI